MKLPFLLVPLLSQISAIIFNLPSRGEKCLKDEAKKDDLITGNYEISPLDGVTIHLKITDSKSHVLFQKDGASNGKFAFSLDGRDFISICFSSSINDGLGELGYEIDSLGWLKIRQTNIGKIQ